MRRNNRLRTTAALAAATALIGACSESNADDDKADPTSSPSTTTVEESSAPDVLPLPGPDSGAEYATLPGGRYRIELSDTLAFEVDVPDDTSSHDNGTFLATRDFILKTEAAGEKYGVPRDPCTDQNIDPVGPTVDDLVHAITKLPIYQKTRPEHVELGGAVGTYIEARIPRTYDASQCAGGAVQLPGNPDTAASGPPPKDSNDGRAARPRTGMLARNKAGGCTPGREVVGDNHTRKGATPLPPPDRQPGRVRCVVPRGDLAGLGDRRPRVEGR